MANVEVYLESALTAQQILEFGFQNVALATGSAWRRDAVARQHVLPPPLDPALPLFTPDDLMAGVLPEGERVLLYDDDHYYMGGVLAELLVRAGKKVTLFTPSVRVSDWTVNTLEHWAIHQRLDELGVEILLNRGLVSCGPGAVVTDCTYTGKTWTLEADALVLVASRQPEDALWRELKARAADWSDAGIRSVKVIGDAEAPGPIAWATYAGHRYARELDGPELGDALPFRREVTQLAR
jgi:dimethylamine/trimethylamine dehydrogenase